MLLDIFLQETAAAKRIVGDIQGCNPVNQQKGYDAQYGAQSERDRFLFFDFWYMNHDLSHFQSY